LLHAELSIIL